MTDRHPPPQGGLSASPRPTVDPFSSLGGGGGSDPFQGSDPFSGSGSKAGGNTSDPFANFADFSPGKVS